jgi:hypothetical protein
MHQAPRRLARRQIRHHHLLTAAQFALQALANLRHRKFIAQVGAQFGEAEARCVQTASTIRAEVVRVINVFEKGGFEFRVVHTNDDNASDLWSVGG